jgi:hypothetical protein
MDLGCFRVDEKESPPESHPQGTLKKCRAVQVVVLLERKEDR